MAKYKFRAIGGRCATIGSITTCADNFDLDLKLAIDIIREQLAISVKLEDAAGNANLDEFGVYVGCRRLRGLRVPRGMENQRWRTNRTQLGLWRAEDAGAPLLGTLESLY